MIDDVGDATCTLSGLPNEDPIMWLIMVVVMVMVMMMMMMMMMMMIKFLKEAQERGDFHPPN